MSASVQTSKPAARDKNRVVIFDTTMRDGEQAPGCSMNLEEKLRIAAVLEEMGVDVIEAGFPIASNGDFEAVREVAKLVANDRHGLGYLEPAAYERTVDVLLSAASNPVIRGRPEGAWTHEIWDRAYPR